MKSVKDIMSELGFDSLGNENTQKAFIRHLIREANRVDGSAASFEPKPESPTKVVNTVVQNKPELKSTVKTFQEQLCFDFDDSKQVS